MLVYEGFMIKASKESPMSYVVSTEGRGGKIPDVLTGLFTSPTYVKELIDNYLAGKPTKETKDDKTGAKS